MVFDIQNFAIHDGPGIRTLVFLKGCSLRCSWCCNPESWTGAPSLRWRSSLCDGCGTCVSVCPYGAASMKEAAQGESGAGYPAFRRSMCAGCTERPCVALCPPGALSVWGERMSLDAVMQRILADRAFYRNSGGGVTFSGGEPLLQADFLEAALERCGLEGIHRAVSTCGEAPLADLARIEPLTDLFLFDIKIVDSALHAAATGSGNERILGNLRWLAARRPADILVRTPLIPGLTDSPENLAAVEALLDGLGIGARLRLPFHELGIPKYAQLGLGYTGPRSS